MDVYLYPLKTAALWFLLAAFLLSVPYMIYCYRKYGEVSILRTFVVFAFIYYMISAYFLVILPLPSKEAVDAMAPLKPQLHPLAFIKDFLNTTGFDIHDTSTYLPAFKSAAFFEPFFNLLLTVPFGAFLTYYLKRGIVSVTISSFFLSLFFELTQLTGLYGIYSKGYRLFSVDDLILNTCGGILGFVLGLFILSILPSRERMDKKSYKKSLKVGYVRRFVADAIDLFIANIIYSVLNYFFNLPFYTFYIVGFIYFTLFALLTGGRTLGKLLANIKVSTAGMKMNLYLGIVLRYILVFGMLLGLYYASEKVQSTEISKQIYYLAIVSVIYLINFINWLAGFFGNKRFWYEYLSGTKLLSTFRAKNKLN